MRDHRIGLKNNTIVSFGHGKDIRITGEVGRGASCIVYDAVYMDSISVQHHVRLKECYPSYLSINRDEKFQLIPSEHHHEKFETAKRDFVDAYRRNAKIRSTLGLVNSTINSTEIASCNHTIYIKMELDEGIDYGKYEDPSLKSLFLHIRSLAELIQKYHQNGYLYLDIKPENIFILPETEEHIILFDFDSVITLEELAMNTEKELSFSIGFSPFEQVQGQIDKIGKHTDIYSIGALTFYKLFSRMATSQECKISSACPFGEMKYADEKYNPKLYRTLDTFFKKTLSVAITPRWHDIQQVIDQLDELIKLSDIDEVYLLDSFQYDSAYFVGRNEEIEEIADTLAENQLIFLSGIGGIGKTELAKQYAHKYRSRYDTVTFSVFEKNIETLVCDEILIHKVARDEDETDVGYFERKLGILKQIATPRDLVIIDNFDVDSDEKLELLFRCPCKFIITTRMDFSDYNYRQIYVNRLRDLGDVLGLFYTYNSKDYQKEESKAVEKLVDYVDRHTMTVELIAKYLRNSEELPTDLYGKFLQKEGATNTGEINVKQRKDFALRSKSVNDHLRILFDLSGFNPAQQEIIRSLSLLAGIRIEKSRFHELCAAEDGENHLELLIRNGWVEYHAESEKISLHQVIQDLVYKDLAPNAENCPRIVEGMEKYVDEESVYATESEVKHKLFEIFMERLSGNNLPYATLCLKYGKENRLEEAEKICLNCSDIKSFDLLPKIYRKKIEAIHSRMSNDIFELPEIIVSLEEPLAQISEQLDKIISYCQKNSEKTDDIVKELLDTASEVNLMLLCSLCSQVQERLPALDYIYNRIIEMLDIATEKLPSTSFSVAKKEELYQEIQDFGGEAYEEGMQGIARIYSKTGHIDMGIDRLEEAIAHGREQGIYSYRIYVDLIKKLVEQKNYQRAKEYAKELLLSVEPNTPSDNPLYSITYALSAYYFLYLLEQEQDRKKDLWQNCLKYYEILGDSEIMYEIYDFIMEYLQKEEVCCETVLKILVRITMAFRYDESGEDIREKIIHCFSKKYTGKDDFKKYHVILLVKLAGLTNVDSYKDLKNGEKNCERAQDYYNMYGLHDNYIQSLIYLTKAELLMHDKDFEYNESIEIKKLCDFELLAKHQISDYDYNAKEQKEIWLNAALQYECTHNYSMMSICCAQALEVLRPILNKYEFRMLDGGYQELLKDFITIYIMMKDFDSAYQIMKELYDRTVEYLTEWNPSVHARDDIQKKPSDRNDGYNNSTNRIIHNPNDTKERAWLISDISYNFIKINKDDDAIRTYFVAIYLLLAPEIDSALLKVGDDIINDIMYICTEINELLNQEIDTEIIDVLIGFQESILICKDSCSFDTQIFNPTITKILDKCQYQEIEFKHP